MNKPSYFPYEGSGETLPYHRLSAFLYKEGGLLVHKLKRLKMHLFDIETSYGKFILKRHLSLHKVNLQWELFESLPSSTGIVPFEHFPNGRTYLTRYNDGWTISRWMPGSVLTYTRRDDAMLAREAIRKFHSVSNGLILPSSKWRPPLCMLWKNRFERFLTSEQLFRKHGKKDVFQSIYTYSAASLKRFSVLDWASIHHRSRTKWNHGDVAAHNFLTNKDEVWMLDFDLLHEGPHVYDWIQFGQRQLPYCTDVTELASLMGEWWTDAIWQRGMVFPADILREFNRGLGEHGIDEIAKLKHLEFQWKRRLEFVDSFTNMVR